MEAHLSPFSVVFCTAGDHLVISVHGDIDLATARGVDDAVERAINDGWHHLVIDLGRVSFMDSAGLHLLMRLRDVARRGTRIEMIGGPAETERLLAIAGLTDVLARADSSARAQPATRPLTSSTFVQRVREAQRSRHQVPPAS